VCLSNWWMVGPNKDDGKETMASSNIFTFRILLFVHYINIKWNTSRASSVEVMFLLPIFKGVADLCKDVVRLWFVQCTCCSRVQHQQIHPQHLPPSFPHRSADFSQLILIVWATSFDYKHSHTFLYEHTILYLILL
jgi:hypothetical protein